MFKDDIINSINKSIASKDYLSALNECKDALSKIPYDAEIHFITGQVFSNLKQYENALEEYGYAIQLCPTNDKYYFEKAELLLKHISHEVSIFTDIFKSLFYNRDEALDCINKAIKLNPSKAIYYLSRGKILYYIEKYDEAIKSLDIATNFSPDNADNFYFKALSLLKLNNVGEALKCLDSAIMLNPLVYDFYKEKIYILFKREEFNKTIDTIDAALKVHKNDSWLHLKKADCLSKLNMIEDAVKEMDVLIQIDTCNAYYYNKKSLFLVVAGRFSEALQMIENAISLEPTNPDYLELKGVVLNKLDRDTEAIKVFKSAIELLNVREEKQIKSEVNTTTQGNSSAHDPFYEYITEISKKRKEEQARQIGRLNFSLSKSLFKINEYTEALSCCEKAISIESNNSKYLDLKRDIIDKKQLESVRINIEAASQQDDLQKCLLELDELIGLASVKEEINSLISFIQVQKMRASFNMPVPTITNHLVFTGNPGTGKTTVARILGKIYKSIGVLSKGHFIEVDRSGLVAGYVGQTAIKTKDKIHESLGGILFIDEAYSLANSSSQNDFGKEAIDTLLKAMEDYRNDFVVIVAGYPDKMENFINSNEGLGSRFNKYIRFEDYNPSELYNIFMSMCKKNGYYLCDEAEIRLKDILDIIYENRGNNFGNGRDVRNIFDKVLINHSNRVFNTSWNKDDLIRIKAEDFKNII